MLNNAAAKPITDLQLLTNSRRACFLSCPRKHWLRYDLCYVPVRERDYFRFGRIVHWGLDELGKGTPLDLICEGIRGNYSITPAWCVSGGDLAKWHVECERVLRLVCGYQWRWAADMTDIVASEQSFDLPLVNPDTGHPSRVFRLAGVIDKVIQCDNEQVGIREHKTTSDSLDSGSTYWRILKRDAQIGLYLIAAATMGYGPEYIEYDVIHKPGIRPHKATKKKPAETITEYGDRLTKDIGERPDFYYARVEVPRLAEDLKSLQRDVWCVAKMIRLCQHEDYHPRSPGRDTCPYCEFNDVCDYADDTFREGPPSGFQRLGTPHPELKRTDNGSTSTADDTESTAARDVATG